MTTPPATSESIGTAAPGLGARSLVAPELDFWLTGGGTLVAYAVYLVLDRFYHFRPSLSVALLMSYFAFVCNYPHFIYSYFLFYRGFFRRLAARETEAASRLRHVVAGVAVPALVVWYFIAAYHMADPRAVTFAVYVMSFTVGWHYVKQGYGALITLSLYDGVFYSGEGKRALWLNAYAVWLFSWLNTDIYYTNVGGVEVQQTQSHVSAWAMNLSCVAMAVTTLASAFVILQHCRSGKGISRNGVCAYVAAVYVWTITPFTDFPFYIVVPFFHSLQYLAFVYKFKKSEFLRDAEAPEGNPERTARRAEAKLGIFVIGGIVVGALSFRTVPAFLDHSSWGFPREGANTPIELATFFLTAFLVFINIHHFFIDSAFWRRDNAEAQRFLFRA